MNSPSIMREILLSLMHHNPPVAHSPLGVPCKLCQVIEQASQTIREQAEIVESNQTAQIVMTKAIDRAAYLMRIGIVLMDEASVEDRQNRQRNLARDMGNWLASIGNRK